jgi:hypothetical protein
MKKLFILAVVAIGFTMTSCKKEYTCACTVSGTTTEVKSGTKLTKKDAEAWCEKSTNGIAGVSCKLK